MFEKVVRYVVSLFAGSVVEPMTLDEIMAVNAAGMRGHTALIDVQRFVNGLGGANDIGEIEWNQ